MFVSFDPLRCSWHVIRSTRGVVDLVRHGLDPVPVPDAVIDCIKSREGADGLVVVARQLNLGPGDRIRIDSGPFNECEAIFQAQRDEDRIVALVRLLGRMVVAQVPVTAVAPAY
jgi:transcriptional antiterminator RfaH